jgi:hypothetical protein
MYGLMAEPAAATTATAEDLEAWGDLVVTFWHAVNRFDAKTLEWFQNVGQVLVNFTLRLLARVYFGVDQAITDRAYLADIREGNRERGVAGHRYRPVDVPVQFTWDAIRLAIQAEAMGSRRYAAGLTT